MITRVITSEGERIERGRSECIESVLISHQLVGIFGCDLGLFLIEIYLVSRLL